MIHWREPRSAEVAAPAAARFLMERAIAARPENAELRVKLADIYLDAFEFERACAVLEPALSADPCNRAAGRRLARCYNALNRPSDALASLSLESDSPELERALALLGLGGERDAEAELRAVLAANPHNRSACRHLCKMLRRSARIREILELCEGLAARGAAHAQLFYSWGTALALDGRREHARALLVDPERIAQLALPVPAGFADIADFNEALADEILTNPYRISEFPTQDEANRGSSRVHALYAGRRPELIRALVASLQQLIEQWQPARYGEFDPWLDARPATARLSAWGLLQRGGEFEEWHLHRGGWLSGVYYVRVPKAVSAAGSGPGCIEFGPPTALQSALPGYMPTWRHAPREGTLLLAPSHYAHRTIPSGVDEHRISFAFDVVPDVEHLGSS